jgi:hypothetical protein
MSSRATNGWIGRLAGSTPALSPFASIGFGAAALAITGCARPMCEPSTRAQGLLIQAPEGMVTMITGEGACSDVRIRCLPNSFSTVFTPGCEYYRVLPRRAGTCTLRIAFASGTIVTQTLDIVDRTGEDCENENSFYARDPAQDGFYVAPTSPDAGADAADVGSTEGG